METTQESPKIIPVVDNVDVLVCAGGPAGVAATVAASRVGAHTRLIEAHGSLGGIWTIGAMAYICGIHESKGGLLGEVMDELRKRGAVGRSERAFDIEQTKLLLEEMCLQSGVKVRLHTLLAAAQRSDSNCLTTIITESKSGREAWKACSESCRNLFDSSAPQMIQLLVSPTFHPCLRRSGFGRQAFTLPEGDGD